jgi:hypothetical protein
MSALGASSPRHFALPGEEDGNMAHRHFSTSLAFVVIIGFAGAARAQEGEVAARALDISPVAMTRALTPVLDQSPVVATVRSNAYERRPPQAPPPDPSKDPDAPPDPRRIKRAVGGLIGGLMGFGASSLLVNVSGVRHLPPPAALAVPIGMILGTLIGGR